MVVVKGRLNSAKEKVIQDQKMSCSGQVRNLKIYEEDDKVKKRDTLSNGTKGKTIQSNSGNNLSNFGDTKSGVKNLEKRKNKTYKSGDSIVGRKVLADIGNVRGSFSKSQQGKSYKPGYRKSEMMMLPEESRRDARGSGNIGATSSDKSSRESRRSDMIQATDNKTSKKPVRKEITSHDPRTRFQSRGTATTNVGKCVRNPHRMIRKSMPVLKKAGQGETSGSAKENSEKSSGGKHGFPMKPRRSIVSKSSSLSSRPWANRISDGFVVMASRAQTKLDSGASLRKSTKPTVKSTSTILSNHGNSKSNNTATKKLRSRPTELSKRKQDKVSVSIDIPSGADHVDSAPKEEDTSRSAFSNRKSGRRSSFISSLMSRSKLLKEPGNIASPKLLPNIYDDRNPLEVSDYVDDIYQYYWVMEGQNSLLKNYMTVQKDVTPNMRGILINWLIEVHQKFELMEETLFLTVTLLDRYLSIETIEKNEFQMVGLTALLLASKYEDFWHPRVSDLISIAAESYTRGQMLEMEKRMLKTLKFRLNQPTPYVFMLRFLKAAQSDKKFEHLSFYLMELCLIEYEALNYKPSMLCASAIYVARCTQRISPSWTPLLTKHTRYEESEIRDCAEMILKFHKAAKTSLLKVTYDKYIMPNRSRVAVIKPLDRLPA